jgi:hypothetical protein
MLRIRQRRFEEFVFYRRYEWYVKSAVCGLAVLTRCCVAFDGPWEWLLQSRFTPFLCCELFFEPGESFRRAKSVANFWLTIGKLFR